MAASKQLWTAQDAIQNLLLGAAVAPSLKNLASGSLQISNDYNNSTASTARRPYADFYLHVRGGVAFSSGDFVAVWLLSSIDDGTTWEDGGVGTTPARSPDIIFPVNAVSTQQNVAIRGVVLPPGHFKVLLKNSTAQAFTNTDNENTLNMETYALEAQ